jgi:hypothetical protein
MLKGAVQDAGQEERDVFRVNVPFRKDCTSVRIVNTIPVMH